MDALALSYPVDGIAPYIDWTYFFHAWGLKPAQQHTGLADALMHDARATLAALGDEVEARCMVRLCHANACDDDLMVEGIRIPLLRQQAHPSQSDAPYLCLSDFVRPCSSGEKDTIGLYATSVSLPEKPEITDDPYRSLMLQTLADRLAEAAAERLHEYVRRSLWGYASQEDLSIGELLKCRYQGIRPAVGYPCLPDQSVIFLINRLLPLKRIGITLTDNGAMHPHASTCGLILAHPSARYFAVGAIGEDQLNDYAQRRGMPVETVRKFLGANLRYQ